MNASSKKPLNTIAMKAKITNRQQSHKALALPPRHRAILEVSNVECRVSSRPEAPGATHHGPRNTHHVSRFTHHAPAATARQRGESHITVLTLLTLLTHLTAPAATVTGNLTDLSLAPL